MNTLNFVNIVNFMSKLIREKNSSNRELDSQFSEKGLIIRDDDQDWGSAGMNNIEEESNQIQ